MKIAVAGTGYVGLVTGVCLAYMGHVVTCVDTNERKIALLQAGKPLIHEEGLEQLMLQTRERLSFTPDFASAYQDAEVIFIAVGTPDKKDGSANLIYVYNAARQIAANIKNDCLVVVKSTVPIGTGEIIEARLKAGLPCRVRVEVASNPEFLSQGTAVRETLHPSRIVLGVESERAEKLLRKVYAGFDGPILVTSRHSAEMIKYASNNFLALKISYVNEIANLCEVTGADISEVTEGMGLDPRIGSHFLRAGVGYGGSCFPKDTKALHWLSSMHKHELKTVRAAIDVNEKQKTVLIRKAHKYYPNLAGINVAVLGLTFKPGTDDLREAPSLACIPMLLTEGAYIRAWDPVGRANFSKLYPQGITYCENIGETLDMADICFIFTEWPEIKQLDLDEFTRRMKKPVVLDGRNCFRLSNVRGKGILYESIGRAIVHG